MVDHELASLGIEGISSIDTLIRIFVSAIDSHRRRCANMIIMQSRDNRMRENHSCCISCGGRHSVLSSLDRLVDET